MPEDSGVKAPVEAPIACSLRGDAVGTRQRWFRDVLQYARGLERSESGVTATFPPDAELEMELGALARAESECCAFLRITVRRTGDALELDVAGPAAARPIIDAMFGSRS